MLVNHFGVIADIEAGLGHAGGVSQGQVALGGAGFGGDHLDLSRPSTRVISERIFLFYFQLVTPVQLSYT